MNVGPLLFSTAVIALLLGVVAGLGVNAFLKKRGYADAGNAALLVLVCALVLARVAFVASWWPQYVQRPLSILNIRDSGFDPLAGLLGLLLAGAVVAWRRPALRRALPAALGAGVLAWGLAWLTTSTLAASTQQPLPNVTLTDLDGQRVALTDLRGQPTVINFWATWCAPCRREMPTLAAAQASMPDYRFVFANQGESSAIVAGFLKHEGLKLDHVLIDTNMDLSSYYGVRGYPTTLFVDADGHLRDTKIGELSAGSLAAHLARISAKGRP